jgi:hypothetical protein
MKVTWIEKATARPRTCGVVPVYFGDRRVGDATIEEVFSAPSTVRLILDVQGETTGFFRATPERVRLGFPDTTTEPPEITIHGG